MGYRLFIDESGDHCWATAADVGKRYLGLVGVWFALEPYMVFAKGLEELKQKHLSYGLNKPPILHRVDIVYARGAFRALQDPEKRAAFNSDLLALIKAADFTIVAVALDKVEHQTKTYRALTHPYHYCMDAMLNRYCGWLERTNSKGDVMAESRGKAENRALREAYQDIYSSGIRYMSADRIQATLTTKEVKLKQKSANIAGLQLADLLAHPLTREVLVAYNKIQEPATPFTAELGKIVRSKYNCHMWLGYLKGYGRVFLA